MNALRRSLYSLIEVSKQSFGLPRWTPALQFAPEIGNPDRRSHTAGSFLDDLQDGILRAVQTNRRSVERRQWRRIGMPQFNSTPRRDLKCCPNCGHFHEGHTLCGHCYAKVKAETELIQKGMSESYGHLKLIDHEVVVKYEGETVEEEPGKKIVEIPKKRPNWFSKNLLQKENQVRSST